MFSHEVSWFNICELKQSHTHIGCIKDELTFSAAFFEPDRILEGRLAAVHRVEPLTFAFKEFFNSTCQCRCVVLIQILDGGRGKFEQISANQSTDGLERWLQILVIRTQDRELIQATILEQLVEAFCLVNWVESADAVEHAVYCEGFNVDLVTCLPRLSILEGI